MRVKANLIDSFIIDFYCAKAKLLIEVDGATHVQKAHIEYDQARTERLERLGHKVIRFTNDDIRYNLNAVIAKIIEHVETRVKDLS